GILPAQPGVGVGDIPERYEFDVGAVFAEGGEKVDVLPGQGLLHRIINGRVAVQIGVCANVAAANALTGGAGLDVKFGDMNRQLKRGDLGQGRVLLRGRGPGQVDVGL